MLNLQTNRNLFFPLTIVLVGIIISGGIFVYRTNNQTNNTADINKNLTQEVGIKPISADDKILGNPNAEVIIVEYSDFECPYCKIFHRVMQDVMYEYGRSGKVAWIFRHFPLESIHKNARNAATSAECVYRIGGSESFWEYSNTLFASSTEILSKENLENIATSMNIDKEKYNACINSPEITKKIDSDIADGKLIYENDPNFGTPYSFIITKTGIQTTVIGAQPLTKMKEIIDQFI
jgi:protein-disulfide isomerase